MQNRRQLLLKAYKLFDLLVMVFCFALASWASYQQTRTVTLGELLSMRVKVENFALFLGLLSIWYTIFSMLRLYHSKRLSSRWSEIINLLKATSLGTLVIYVTAILFRIQMVNLAFLAIFFAASSVLMVLSRLILRYLLERIRLRGRNLRHMLIVGTNSRAVDLARKIESKAELGYRLIGFVDNGWAQNHEFQAAGYPLLTDFDGFPLYIRENVVDEVMIFLPVKSFYDQISKIVAVCEEQGITVRFLSEFFRLRIGHTRPDSLEDHSVITVYTGSMAGLPILMKRVLDFFLSSVLLIVLAPLFAITALLIKITSPGPVFFVQERVGLNKRRFRLYKFRTMSKNAEQMQSQLETYNEADGPVFKMKSDPRITRLGKILRKISVDELPQLLNVLKGDMSLVGPRPLPFRDYEGFKRDWYRRRFSVRPGITCLWQVKGRHKIPFDKWMELDMEYIDNWSLLLDLRILIKTIPAIITGSGAL